MGLNHLTFKIVRADRNDSFLQTDMIVLYMLDGEMNVCCYGNGVRLKKEDILLINPGVEYEINGIKDAIYAAAGLISKMSSFFSLTPFP